MKRKVSYTASNHYESLNSLTERTQYIWIVFHGMGYLSRYFLKYFKGLPADEHYIIAPQAPSRYYMDKAFKNVGASWLTKEDTELEKENVLKYLDAVFGSEGLDAYSNIIVLGYSQGVSIASRWVAHRKLECKKLIFYAGGIPNELGADDFDFLSTDTPVYLIYGDEDPYLTKSRLEIEKEKLNRLFGKRTHIINFKGGHELKPQQLDQIINK